MKRVRILMLVPVFIMLLLSESKAQVTELIAQLDLGIGGGVSLPTGQLNDSDNTGYHGVGKLRLHGLLPLSITGMVMYNRLPNKSGGESHQQWMVGAGLEYPIRAVAIHPYFGADVFYSGLSSTAAGSTSTGRGGIGLGGGVVFGLPGMGGIDASVKYQMFNLIGKDSGENTYSQVAASVAFMFNVM